MTRLHAASACARGKEREREREEEEEKEKKETAAHSAEQPGNGEPQDEGSFEAFYRAFPRKVAKTKARVAYEKALMSAPADALLKAAEQYAQEKRDVAEKFIKQPDTWLSEMRWTDGQAGVVPEKVKILFGWAPYAAQMIELIGVAEFQSYYGRSILDIVVIDREINGEPITKIAVITVGLKVAVALINEKHSNELNKVFSFGWRVQQSVF